MRPACDDQNSIHIAKKRSNAMRRLAQSARIPGASFPAREEFLAARRTLISRPVFAGTTRVAFPPVDVITINIPIRLENESFFSNGATHAARKRGGTARTLSASAKRWRLATMAEQEIFCYRDEEFPRTEELSRTRRRTSVNCFFGENKCAEHDRARCTSRQRKEEERERKRTEIIAV